MLTLYQFPNDEWVAWTVRGYYIASPNGNQRLGWQINQGLDQTADYVNTEQWRESLNRPDIVANTIRLGSSEKAIAEAGDTAVDIEQLIED